MISIEFHRVRHAKWNVQRGGQATEWPWFLVSIARVGEIVVGRTNPRKRGGKQA